MKARFLVAAIFFLVCQSATAAPPKKAYDVVLEDTQRNVKSLNVSFYKKIPPPTVVDKILRESLDHAILIDPSVDILAIAFFGDDTLKKNQYGGSLIYKASQKKVITFDEYRGGKTLSTVKP